MNLTELIRECEAIEAYGYRKAEESLSVFTRFAWEILEPHTKLLWNWHNDCVADYLTAVSMGQIKRLIINVPPRYMKSIQISVCFPAWTWAKEPQHRFLCASYAQNLSTKHSIDTRALIESDWYQKGWGSKFQLSSDQNQKMEFENTARGHRKATALLGVATGHGGDTIIIDDPHDTTGAASDTERVRDVETFQQKFTTRLNNKKEGRIIVVMQRLHEEDLTGVLLKEGGWEHLCLPGIAETKTIITFPVKKRVITREPNDLLHPEREGWAEINQQKRSLRDYGFSAQYQQRPTPAEGGMIKRKWIKFYTQLPSHIEEYAQGWDLTFKDGPTNDFVNAQCWCRNGSNVYLVGRMNERMDFPTTLDAFRSFTARHPKAIAKLVEVKANGQALIDMLTKKIAGIIPYDPKCSKEARVSAVSAMWEAGNVWLPDPSIAPWIHDYIDQIVTFPNAAHDDEVDAMSLTLMYLQEKINSGGIGLRVIRR